MEENMNDLSNIVVLNDENGNEVEFEFLDLIEINSREFVVLYPTDDDDGEVVILEVESLSEEEDSYIGVTDEKLLMQVYELFKERNKDILNFED